MEHIKAVSIVARLCGVTPWGQIDWWSALSRPGPTGSLPDPFTGLRGRGAAGYEKLQIGT
jgi:hypothetical protein